IGDGARTGSLGRQPDIDAVVAYIDGIRLRLVAKPGGRGAVDRVVVVAVPRAAQPALLDRPFAERSALVRATIVQRSVAAAEARERERAVSCRDRLHSALG